MEQEKNEFPYTGEEEKNIATENEKLTTDEEKKVNDYLAEHPETQPADAEAIILSQRIKTEEGEE